jgi:predicted DNA-binding transcriptional regulator AlpA
MPEYEFIFVLRGIGLDDAGIRTLERYCDAVISSWHGVVYMTVTGEGPDAVSAGLNIAQSAKRLVPDLQVERLDRDLVGVADIAERTDRSRQNVDQWVKGERHRDHPFPQPEGTVGSSLVWLWSEVNDWLHPLGLDDGELHPTRAEMNRLDVLLSGAGSCDAPLPTQKQAGSEVSTVCGHQ